MQPSLQSPTKLFPLPLTSSQFRLCQGFNKQENFASTDTVSISHLMKMLAIRMANQPLQPLVYLHLLSSLTFPTSNITTPHMLLETSFLTAANFISDLGWALFLVPSLPMHRNTPLPTLVRAKTFPAALTRN